jgi:hypothetical protein
MERRMNGKGIFPLGGLLPGGGVMFIFFKKDEKRRYF